MALKILLDLVGYAVAFVAALAVAFGVFAVGLRVLGQFEERVIASWILFGVAGVAGLVLLVWPPKQRAVTMRVAAIGVLLGSMLGCTGNMYEIGPAPGFGTGQELRKP
jgi:hypothetical protein